MLAAVSPKKKARTFLSPFRLPPTYIHIAMQFYPNDDATNAHSKTSIFPFIEKFFFFVCGYTKKIEEKSG
jgi:hypothetical protein